MNFGGCAVVINHDRWFLDRVATHILAFEGDEIIWHEGNYESLGSSCAGRRAPYGPRIASATAPSRIEH